MPPFQKAAPAFGSGPDGPVSPAVAKGGDAKKKQFGKGHFGKGGGKSGGFSKGGGVQNFRRGGR